MKQIIYYYTQKIFGWINQGIFLLYGWSKFWLVQANNLFHATNDGLFGYDLFKSNGYFSWRNQILIRLTKNLGLFLKMVCLKIKWIFLCVRNYS